MLVAYKVSENPHVRPFGLYPIAKPKRSAAPWKIIVGNAWQDGILVFGLIEEV
jgi:hypothetical protein